MQWKIELCLTRNKCLKWLDTHTKRGCWTFWFQWHMFWGCTFRCFWVMVSMYALSLKLLIIGLPLKYFAILLKILHLKKIAAKCFTFLHHLYFFLWEGQGHFLGGIRIKYHLVSAKEWGKRSVWRKKPKMRPIFAKLPLFSKIQTLSHKLLVR